MINILNNYFFEALKNEFGILRIEIDKYTNVRPVKCHSWNGRDITEYPPVIHWTFDDKTWYCYSPRPKFKHTVKTMNFFEFHSTEVSYDENELIKVIKLSAEGKTADEINLITNGRIDPPRPKFADDGYEHVYSKE